MHLHLYRELEGVDIFGESTCKIWVYKDILEQKRMSLFDHYIRQSLDGDTRINVEGRKFELYGQQVNLAGTAFRHNYIKIWSLLDYKEYYYQTADTVYDWYQSKLADLAPGLRQLVDVVKDNVEVFKDKGPVIPLRFFVNVFPAGQAMDLHIDGTKESLNIDLEEGDLWSATYYLQVPKVGGELWFPNTDFSFRPEVNSLAIFNGNKFYHGVKGVPHDDLDRISITIRYAAVNEMFWPGHPDKFLYKPNLDVLK